MTHRTYLRLVIGAVVIGLFFAGSIAVRGVIEWKRDVVRQGELLTLQRQQSLTTRQSRIVFQARETFLLCSRKPTLVSVSLASDVRRACTGYRTFNQALATEARLSPIAVLKPGG